MLEGGLPVLDAPFLIRLNVIKTHHGSIGFKPINILTGVIHLPLLSTPLPRLFILPRILMFRSRLYNKPKITGFELLHKMLIFGMVSGFGLCEDN